MSSISPERQFSETSIVYEPSMFKETKLVQIKEKTTWIFKYLDKIKLILQIFQVLLCAGAGLVSARPQFGPIGPAHGPHHAPGYAPVKIPPRPFAYEYGVQVT